MIVDDGTLVTALGVAVVGVSAFYAWQQRFLMSMLPELRASIDRNTEVCEKIMMLIERQCK